MTPTEAAIDRRSGIGGSDISAVVGMNPFRSPWDVWAEKSGLLDDVVRETTSRMRRGKRFEKLIAEEYTEQTGREHIWLDATLRADREWQLWTPDAVCVSESRGIDCKMLGLDRLGEWGDPGGDEVPQYIALQSHWYMNASGLEAWDIAALFGGDSLRIYTVQRDRDIEGMLLEEGERFWRDHILAGIAPEMTATPSVRAWLKSRFPRNNGILREPDPLELAVLDEYRSVRSDFGALKEKKENLEVRIQTAIGDDDGFSWNGSKFTYKRTKDRRETNWEALAVPLLEKLPDDERKTLIALQTRTIDGYRRIYTDL